MAPPHSTNIYGKELLGKVVSLHGHDELFVGGDGNEFDFGFRSGDDAVFAGIFLVGFEVELGAEEFETLADGFALEPGVFADAAGEEDDIDSAHGGSVGTDIFLDEENTSCKKPLPFISGMIPA